MAGKSTYLRSAALITIMAQMGSFVSAREARIGLCDRIYCRVGASDNLARGESTFLVEMNETAYILNTATEQSLVIMDEVGRGTGTRDGLSIAWAVSEELLNQIKCRTLFATHYHELSLISHPRLANRSMEVLDKNGEIIFLRKLKEGPAAESYGLHVARMAGLSNRVLERAGRIMDRLEERSRELYSSLPGAGAMESVKADNTVCVDTGAVHTYTVDISIDALNRFLADLAAADPDNMTPMEALHKLQSWKEFLAAPDLGRHGKSRKAISAEKKSPGLFDS
jgi:DNA mismatch repair protein MutS